ncbi:MULTISPECIES: NAD(P)H-quinone oxidoreductase [unclassified Enterococcus]|jgi:NADPH2:quinone reductase|uniref:NAD(P)H-quinone oxidoreductase n=1 Tax=unclassified Enterococcus TaxID=2608891 RepID=UPI003D2CA6CE
MRAVTVERPGSADMLRVVDRPMPEPLPGQLLVKVHAASVNRTDILWRENASLKPPYPVLGVEVSGEVVKNNSNDTRFSEGTRVFGLVNLGGYAEYALLPADRAMIVPDNLDYTEAAGISEVFLTAYQTLYWLGKLKKNDTVLIHAGASGVGTAAIQLAKQLSEAQVIVTAGSEKKLEFCRQLGADETINYKSQEFDKEIAKITSNRGVDVILDFIGASYWEKNLASIAIDGRWVLIGTLGGSVVKNADIGALMNKRVQLTGTLLTPRSDEYKAELTQEFYQKAASAFEEGKIRPIIDRTFPLENVHQAQQYMEADKNIGKIILTIE